MSLVRSRLENRNDFSGVDKEIKNTYFEGMVESGRGSP